MAEPTPEQAVRIVLIPEALYKKLEKIARKNNATVSGLTCRAVIDFLDRFPPEKQKKTCTKRDKTNPQFSTLPQ